MLKKKLIGGSIACALAMNCLMTVPFTSAAELKYEFEDGTLTGYTKVATSMSGYSGTGYVDLTGDANTTDHSGDTITVTVTVPSAGMYDLTICASAAYGDGKQHSIVVNGQSQGNMAFSGEAFSETEFGAVKLEAGENTITIVSGWGWTMFDYLTIDTAELETLNKCNILSDPNATAEAQGLMNYMATVYGEYIVSGQQEIYGGGHNNNYEWEFDYLYDLTGEYPAIRGFDYLNTNPMCGWDDGTTERIIEWVNERGGIATTSWHLNVPKDFANYTLGTTVDWTAGTFRTDTDFKVQNIVNDPTSKEYQYFMDSVEMLAAELKQLQDAGVPIMFRPLHEAEGAGGETGSWFWWGMDGSATYKELWKLLYTTLTEEYGLHNLIWEFNSYTYSKSFNWYPGNEYVDLVGYDKYNATANNPNESAISTTFNGLVDMYNKYGKMVAMMECDTIPSVENMTSENAYWLYFCPWYEGDTDDGKFLTLMNNPDTLKTIYQSETVITLDELPDYKTYEYTGEEFIPATTEPTEPTQPTQAPDEGHAKVVEEDGYTALIFPEAVGESFMIEVEFSDGVTYANGGIGAGSMIGDKYYWANINWEATASGVVEVDTDNFYNVTTDDGATVVTDEAIISQLAQILKTENTTFQAQVWWAGEGANEVDTSSVKFTDAYLADSVGTTDTTEPTTPPVVVEGGFYVDGQTIRDANGNEFIMRGVNIAHCWYKNYTQTSIEAAADRGTNCVRIVCSNGVQWDKTTAAEIQNIIDWCKANKQICILEVHDATGNDDASAIVAAAEYWTEMTDILNENKAYVILNIANEWYGQWNSDAWAEGVKQAIGVVRDAGIENMIMIDCAGWGQYPTSIKDKGAEVFAADPNKNTVFSMHMYEYAGGTADMIKSNIEGAMECGAPIVIGEFGYKHTDGDVDEAYLMDYCVNNDIGYIGWSWKGNSGGVEYLDLVSDWEGTTLTEWGEIFFNSEDGIATNSDICTVYEASASTDVMYGDVNLDGSVTIVDVIYINKAVLGAETLDAQQKLNADVDINSNVEAADSLCVLKSLVDLLTLPVNAG